MEQVDTLAPALPEECGEVTACRQVLDRLDEFFR